MAVPAVVGVLQDALSDFDSQGTEFTPTFSAYSAGDLLVIVGAASDGLASVSNGTGWTQLGVSASPYQLFVYYKVAGSSSDTIPTFNLNSWSRYSWTTSRCASGSFDTTTPVDAFGTATGTFGDPTAPSVTPTATRDHNWITAAAHGGDGTPGDAWTAPSGATLLGAGHSIDWFAHAAAREDHTSAGATGTAAFTLASTNNNWNAVSFLIRPSSGATNQTVTLVPIDVAVTPVALTPSSGSVTVTLVPIEVALTPVALTPAAAGDTQTIALTPIEVALVPVALLVVAPEFATDIVQNDIWIRERDHPEVTWRAAIVGVQGSALVLEMRSGVDYEFRTLATKSNGAVRWSEWTHLVGEIAPDPTPIPTPVVTVSYLLLPTGDRILTPAGDPLLLS